ncbi:MAG TPA: alanine racemase, partial [Blastocatellia bacterium]|nr:alanine racemase [Blastocatellia bacterium]
WRPHVKTAKLASVIERFIAHRVKQFKCSTTLELKTSLEAGAEDVLLAYPVVGANARRAREIASEFGDRKISALIEDRAQIEAWRSSRVGLFVDVNPGMNRTGVEQERAEQVVALAREIESAGLSFRGLHYYDGHMSKYDLKARESAAHQGYDRLIELVGELESAGLTVEEVITAGTPAFPCTLSYDRFRDASFVHRASPGTIVYGDMTSLAQLPEEYGYRPAAIVISTVVSHPAAGLFTCDAGHKTVSADAGVPTCAVLGHADFKPLRPSEEHLPVETGAGRDVPALGETIYLVPRHVCPTVNNFDYALIVVAGEVQSVERVTARGREAPLEL